MIALALSVLAHAAPVRCNDGKTSDNVDFEGHCCYDGQVWSGSACVGIPVSCPPGRVVDEAGQTCRGLPCEDGQVQTRGMCCWPGQAWSSTLQVCKGIPNCPAGYEAKRESCARPGEVPTGLAAFTVQGDGGEVWLEANGVLYHVGDGMPPGVYTIKADFRGATVVTAGTLHLRAGDRAVVVCSSVFQACRATNPAPRTP